RTAERAAVSEGTGRAIEILSDARRELPSDSRVLSALASLYLKQHDYDAALEVYRSWGLTHANAGDYRAAAGAALAARRDVVAERFLFEGRQQWPRDPELLHMTAMEALRRDQYDESERSLQLTLSALKTRDDGNASSPDPLEAENQPSGPIDP